jgi:hypothetical protein
LTDEFKDQYDLIQVIGKGFCVSGCWENLIDPDRSQNPIVNSMHDLRPDNWIDFDFHDNNPETMIASQRIALREDYQ